MGSGYRDFTAGAILTADQVDGFLMRQTVMTFADASARDTALSGVLDEGMVAYLEDTNDITIYDGSIWRTTAAGKRIARGTFSGTTDGSSSALTVTHSLGWTPTAVVVQPALPNGASSNNRFVSANITSLGATTFVIGRCVAQDGSLLTSTSVSGYWIAYE